MIHRISCDPMYGLAVCIMAFAVGRWIQGKLRSPLANPLLIAILLVIAAHYLLGIPYENFNAGGRTLSMLLAPATASLAVAMYRRRDEMRRALLPLAAGCLAGSVVSVASVWLFCRLFQFDWPLTASLLPKSVTTPIAVSLAPEIGGVASIATAAVIITGMLGAVFAPMLIRIFRVDDPLAQGIAIGVSSHAVGTSRAIELGEIQGAISGMSIGAAGLATALLFLFI